MTPGERACSAVVWFLSTEISRAFFLRERHSKADDGSCRGCCTQMAPTKYPCIIRDLAELTIARSIPTQRAGS